MNKGILTFLIIAASAFITPAAHARGQGFPQGEFDTLVRSDGARVVRVIDPLTLQLDDGRVMRLSGIDLPDYNVYKPGPLSVLALAVMKDMLEGQAVNVYQTRKDNRGRMNRMGQQMAHIERVRDRAWVQGALIGLGLARVMTTRSNPEMADEMYQIEQTARESKIGLWASPAWRVRSPDDAYGDTGTVQVVEGRVRSAALREGRIYLNFGADWREDFTVTIPSESRRAFTTSRIDPLKWNNKTIRVRGWIGDYNGPFIEIDHPERIEQVAP